MQILTAHREDVRKAQRQDGETEEREFRMETDSRRETRRKSNIRGPDGRERVLAASSRPCAGFMSSKIRDRFWVLGGDMGAKVKGKVGRSQRWESAQELHIRHK